MRNQHIDLGKLTENMFAAQNMFSVSVCLTEKCLGRKHFFSEFSAAANSLTECLGRPNIFSVSFCSLNMFGTLAEQMFGHHTFFQ